LQPRPPEDSTLDTRSACRIMNLDPEVVPTSKLGEKAGLGTYHSDNIELVGERIDSFTCDDFDVIQTPPDHCNRGTVRTFIKNRLCERPAINRVRCTNCGACVKMCPVEPKAVDWRKGDKTKPPMHRYDLCICCFWYTPASSGGLYWTISRTTNFELAFSL